MTTTGLDSKTHLYNKLGKDLGAKLESLGAEKFVELGLGDDQEADPDTSFESQSCGNPPSPTESTDGTTMTSNMSVSPRVSSLPVRS